MPPATTIIAAGRRVIGATKPAQNITGIIPDPDRILRAKLDELASRVRRLTVSARNPEKFFEDRSEIAAELLRLAGAVR